MRRVFLPSLTAIALLATTGAYAAHVTGAIRSVNPKSHLVTLHNGSVYHLPRSYNIGRLTPGEKVTITYHNQGGRHMATSVAHG